MVTVVKYSRKPARGLEILFQYGRHLYGIVNMGKLVKIQI